MLKRKHSTIQTLARVAQWLELHWGGARFFAQTLTVMAVVGCFAVAARAEEAPGNTVEQEIGGMFGVAIGGGVSPGGIAVDGRYLYRLNELDWLESGVHFSLGSRGVGCVRGAEGVLDCDHGLLDGFAGELSIGVRRYFAGQKVFRPYARLGIGVRTTAFSGDPLRGVAVPLHFGAGLRATVARRVSIVGEATGRAGGAYYNRNLGFAFNYSLAMGVGVEFTLE